MLLRSSEESKSEKGESDCCLENRDAVDEKEFSSNCSVDHSLDGVAEKRANEAEHKVCVDKATDDHKVGMGEKESRNADVTVLPLGSMVPVSRDNLIASSPEREIAKKRVACDAVDGVTVGVKEGKELAPVNLSLLEADIKEERVVADTCQLKVSAPNSPHKVATRYENQSENAEPDNFVDESTAIKGISGNEDKKTPSVLAKISFNENSSDVDGAKEKVNDEETMVSMHMECNEKAEGAPVVEKRKRGRKKKVVEVSKSTENIIPSKVKVEKDVVKINGRVLRSRTMTESGSVRVEERSLNETVVGFKRQMEAECFDQTELQREVNANSQLTGKRQKKQKRRGRPPKIQGAGGVKRKIKEECLEQTDPVKEVNEGCQLTCRPQKKQKRCGRGRPPKVQVEEPVLQEIQKKKHKDTVIKNRKGRGRPLKVQARNLSIKSKKPDLNDIKLGPKIPNVQNDDQASEITGDNTLKITGDNTLKDKISVESKDHITADDTVKDHNTQHVKSSVGGLERRKMQQLVRDKIVSIIVKAGWTIEYRRRQKRDYLDAVYVDQKGKTHWSITKAYFSLKKKIENGDATSKEISVFTPIPDEEMNVLFRCVSKERSDKNKKKNKRSEVPIKAEIVIKGEAQLKKKPGKKSKEIHKKSSNVKLKKDKSRHEHGIIAESSFKRQPKVSQKDRQSRKPCLVARSSTKGLDEDNCDNTIYSRKRNLFSWMIDLGGVVSGSKLQYVEGRKRSGLLEGTVTCDGIHCSCCNEVMDLSNFVSHGGQKLDQALKNIYFQSAGSSLLMCLLESWKKEVEMTNIRFNYVDVKGGDPNDDTCNICGDGGDLICCDTCPSTFHQSCLDIQNFPSGDWHCIYCCCKFCGLVVASTSQLDDSSHASISEMLTCGLCEGKFHHSCLQVEDVNVGSSSLSFCGSKCQELYEQLQTYIGVKFELKEGYSWTLLKRFDISQNFTLIDDPLKVECNSRLAVAHSVMNECFMPIMDERSGVNRIHNVVYNCGSNFRRLDYSGFLTAILEKGGELMSAASIRIHGDRLAEMPFIGTRNMYRRQGMCRRLLDAIEHALSSLGVGELVIPAIPELYKTWTEVFGFRPLEKSMKQAMKSMSMIAFPGTDMLQKALLKNKFADEKAVECAEVVNDDDTPHLEIKSLNPRDHIPLKSESPTTSTHAPEAADVGDSDLPLATGVKTSPLTSKVVPKVTFDLNLQPAAIDTDIPSIEDETISRDPQVCTNSFELSDSRAQVDNNATQPLVLV